MFNFNLYPIFSVEFILNPKFCWSTPPVMFLSSLHVWCVLKPPGPNDISGYKNRTKKWKWYQEKTLIGEGNSQWAKINIMIRKFTFFNHIRFQNLAKSRLGLKIWIQVCCFWDSDSIQHSKRFQGYIRLKIRTIDFLSNRILKAQVSIYNHAD